MNAVAMIAACMQRQSLAIPLPYHDMQSRGAETVEGHKDTLARVADEGVVDGARNWSEREAVVNDAGQVVERPPADSLCEPVVVPIVVLIAGDGRCR